jgi:hypothetical protein
MSPQLDMMTITLGLPHKFSYNHPRKSVGLLAEFIPIYWASMLVIKAELQQTISHKYPFIYRWTKWGCFSMPCLATQSGMVTIAIILQIPHVIP